MPIANPRAQSPTPKQSSGSCCAGSEWSGPGYRAPELELGDANCAPVRGGRCTTRPSRSCFASSALARCHTGFGGASGTGAGSAPTRRARSARPLAHTSRGQGRSRLRAFGPVRSPQEARIGVEVGGQLGLTAHASVAPFRSCSSPSAPRFAGSAAEPAFLRERERPGAHVVERIAVGQAGVPHVKRVNRVSAGVFDFVHDRISQLEAQ